MAKPMPVISRDHSTSQTLTPTGLAAGACYSFGALKRKQGKEQKHLNVE